MSKTTPNPATGLAFNHAMIYARDVDASVRFYAQALGFRILSLRLPYYARLKAPKGGATIALHALEPGMELMPGAIRLYFEAPDLAAAVRRVKKAGYGIKQPVRKMPWGWKHAYLDDPSGHEVSLYSSGGLRAKKDRR